MEVNMTLTGKFGFAKFPPVIVIIVGIIAFLCIGTAYASYTHSLLTPWGESYQTATYHMQDTFGSLTKSQSADAMIEWDNELTKQFLFKSSVDVTDTTPSNNGVKTITKNDYGNDAILGENIPYYNLFHTYVLETDIRVNIYYPFANSAQPGKYDIQSLLTHELGHSLRIGHSTVASDTMFDDFSTNDESYRTVTAADGEAARASTARWFN